MEIKVYQSGGFAGERIKLKEIVDKEIPPQKIATLHELLDKSGIFTVTEKNKFPQIPDGFDNDLQYEILITDNNNIQHSVTFIKSPDTKALAELLDYLMNL